MLDSLRHDCPHHPEKERYGLLKPNDNCFYIIDYDFDVLKNVQLAMLQHEFMVITYIDHFFTFLPKTQQLIDKFQIDALTENHNNHVANANIIQNQGDRIEQVQKTINNDNCFLFGLTPQSARSYAMDHTHFRLVDNIITHSEKPDSFDEDVCEKLFFLRRVFYIVSSLEEYLLEFARLQERIGIRGLTSYKEYFKNCYPEDTHFEKIIDRDIDLEHRRKKTIKSFIQTVQIFINKLDLKKSVPELIEDILAMLPDISRETYKRNPSTMRSYESNRISLVLQKELQSILKAYESTTK